MNVSCQPFGKKVGSSHESAQALHFVDPQSDDRRSVRANAGRSPGSRGLRTKSGGGRLMRGVDRRGSPRPATRADCPLLGDAPFDKDHVLATTRIPVSRVTSKLQVTVPKAIAERYGIRPGDDIDWVPAGDVIRVVPAPRRLSSAKDSRARRLALFDQATERQRERERSQKRRRRGTDRGWRREDLYGRGRTR